MLSKRFLPAFFILCVLLVGCAFATSSEQPKENLPKSVIAAVESLIIYEGNDVDKPLYAVLMGVGQEREIKGIVSGDNITNFNILWNTDNWNIARIAGQERDGDEIKGNQIIIEARASGTAKITAKSEADPTFEEQICMVYVQNSLVPVEKVLINKEEIGILSGYTAELTASVIPPHTDFPGSEGFITWYTSNPETVQIDPTTKRGNRVRLLTSGLQTGTAYISAVSDYSGGRGETRPAATCTVHHYVEGPRSTEGGCSAGSTSGLLALFLLAPLLLFLKR